jgi:hypothetical protein
MRKIKFTVVVWELVFAILSTSTFLEGSYAFLVSERSSRQLALSLAFKRYPLVIQATAQDTNGKSEETSTLLETPQETKVYELLEKLSDSKLSFRIVVVGNGAILESTNVLGPTFKLNKSPKTGSSIVTFASEDQSFEFHLMPAQIASAVLVEKPSPTKEGKTMRLLRLLNSEGGSVCSLILADDSGPAESWFQSISSTYGTEIDF